MPQTTSSLAHQGHFSIRNANTDYKADLLDWKNINSRISDIILETRRFCNVEFDRQQERFYVLIYGSYAYKLAQTTSDLDIMFVADQCDKNRMERIINFIKQLHAKYGMRIDDEIPYESKVLVKTDFIARACEGEGIYHDNRWDFPVIEKNLAYLTSEKLLLRFILGMQANPHIFVDGDHELYHTHRLTATKNLIKALLSIHGETKTSSLSLLKKFCQSKEGVTGDYYLGFSFQEPFKAYLAEFIETVLYSLKKPNSYNMTGAEYTFTPAELLSRELVTPGENRPSKIISRRFSI